MMILIIRLDKNLHSKLALYTKENPGFEQPGFLHLKPNTSLKTPFSQLTLI
jgi:hypothetical protein